VQASQLGLPFDHAEDATLMSGTNDSVGFPVTEATLAGDDLRTLLNAGTVGDLAPADVSAIPLALFL
jgi:hypothetical protein